MFFAVLIWFSLFCVVPAVFAMEYAPGELAYREAMELREKGEIEQAERKILEALEIDPGNSDYHFELGNIYSIAYDTMKKSGYTRNAAAMLKRAADQFEQSVMIQPDFVAAHYNLGIIYKNQGEYEKAREKFRKVLQYDPASVPSYMQIGAVYEAQGFFAEARDSYEQAKELDFYNPHIQSAIEDLKENQVRYQTAIRTQDLAQQFDSLNRSFRYSAFSHANDFQRDRVLSQRDAQGVAGAIPYVASMIMDEFMKWQQRRRSLE